MSAFQGTPVPDEELIRRIQGDPEGAAGRTAADQLFGRYRRLVYLWCYRYTREHERALDLAQDCFVSAWRALPRYDNRSPFACWIYTIARNRCLSAMRPVSLTRDDDADPEHMVDERSDPVAEVENREEGDAMMELVTTTLDPREQDAVYLRCWERLPVDEITRLLGVAGNSGARALLQTARRKLRAALERRARMERGT